MNGRPRRIPPRRPEFITGIPEVDANLTPELRRYAALLAGTGRHPREVARAVLYANEYGMESLSGPGCVTFDEPSCENWDCLNPTHQRVSK